MTVNTASNKTIVSGNGAQTVFTFGFIGVAAQYITVIFTDASGNQTTLSQGSGATQYQINLNAPVQGAIWGVGGTVTYNPSGTPIALGTTLTIFRTLPLTQAISLQNQLSTQTLGAGTETAIDESVMEIQQVQEAQNRVLSAPIVDPSTINLTLPPAAQRANTGLAFDGSGNVIAGTTPATGLISSAMQPVVDASTIAVARSLLGLGSDYVNVTAFGAVADGVTDNTVAITAAMTSAASTGRGIYFPAGIYATDVLTIPAALSRFFGESRGAVLKFTRRAYGGGSALISITNNTANLQIDTLGFDVNNVLFNNTLTIVSSGSNNLTIANLLMTGEAEIAIRVSFATNVIVRDVTCVGTNDGFNVCIQGDDTGGNLSRMHVEDCDFTGVHTYGCELINGDGLMINNCRSKGNTGAGFAFGLSGATYSEISGCYSLDSSHEAFQLTDCSYSSIIGNHGAWVTLGTDFGISINGTAITATFNKIVGNTLINSYSSGIALADWSQGTIVADNVLRNCAVRATTAAIPNVADMICYTVTAGAQNHNNTFTNNTAISEGGTTTYGFLENNGGGGGSVVDNNFCKDNLISGITTQFLLSGANSKFYDLNFQTYVPVVTSGSGTITSYTINVAAYLLRGKAIELQLDITITDHGTGGGALIVTLPIAAATNGGALSGRDIVNSGKGVDGACSGSTVQLFLSDVASPVTDTTRVVVSGVYRTN